MLNTEHIDQLRALIKVTNSFIEGHDYSSCGLIEEGWEFKVMGYIVSLRPKNWNEIFLGVLK